ncbi:MAG: hypothetical protein KFW07_02835 [Mycoplasmataceae bacterium]|nr:hypothetical protein [Mycoplasmataceae bacterium]
MRDIIVVIPAGGSGERFNDTEFINLKPFINLLGKSMFEWLLIGFKSNKYNVEFKIIIREQFKEQYIDEIDYLTKKYNVDFHYINLVTEGTTSTALFLYDEMNNDDFLLLANCDQIVDINFDDFLDEHFALKVDGSILVFDNLTRENKWSYVKVDRNNMIELVKAKDPISNLAVVGWYCYTKSKYFLSAGIKQIINLDKVNGEYYLCPTFNYLIKEGKKIGAIKISTSKMHAVGTPEDLRIYLSEKNAI